MADMVKKKLPEIVFVNIDIRCKKSPGKIPKNIRYPGRLMGCWIFDMHGNELTAFMTREGLVDIKGKPPFTCRVASVVKEVKKRDKLQEVLDEASEEKIVDCIGEKRKRRKK